MKSILVLSVILALTGCASTSLVKEPAGVSVSSVGKRNVVGLAWWNDYPDPVVKELIADGLKDGKSVQSLIAKLQGAETAANSVDLGLGPSGSIGVGNATTATSGKGQVSTLAFQSAASWALPLFGKREGTQQLKDADYLQALWDVEAQKQVLAGSLIVGYTDVQLSRFRYLVSKDNVYLLEQLKSMLEAEVEKGMSSQDDLDKVKDQLATAEKVKSASLSKVLAAMYSLSALLGKNEFLPSLPQDYMPSNNFKWIDSLPKVDLNDPNTLRDRPDVKKAEAALLKAGAALKISESELYPQLSLSFSNAKDASVSGSGISMFGVQLSLPLLNWYALNQQHKITSRYFESSIYDYQDALIAAWSAVGKARAEWTASMGAESEALQILNTATKSVVSAEANYKMGRVSYKDVISKKLAHGSAKLNYYDAYMYKISSWVKAKQETLR